MVTKKKVKRKSYKIVNLDDTYLDIPELSDEDSE